MTASAETQKNPAVGLTLFFATTFAITWVMQAPYVLARRGMIAGPPEAYIVPMGLAALGPLLGAVRAFFHDAIGAEPEARDAR